MRVAPVETPLTVSTPDLPLDVAASRPFVAGLHVWKFADFKTGQGIIRMAGLIQKGVFTRDRRPKMAAHFLRSRRGGESDRGASRR